MIEIQILEQGTYPQDKPSEGVKRRDILWFDGDGFCELGHGEKLEDTDLWIVVSKPKKALEEMTEDELVEKFEEECPNTALVVHIPDGETLREALIRNLK